MEENIKSILHQETNSFWHWSYQIRFLTNTLNAVQFGDCFLVKTREK